MLPGKGVIAGSTVFERPDEIRMARREARREASGKTERRDARGTAPPSGYDPGGAELD